MKIMEVILLRLYIILGALLTTELHLIIEVTPYPVLSFL